MLTVKLAFRTIMRRKGRMALIGSLVAFGSFLLAFGGIFAHSAAIESKDSIIRNFTGDFIVYSAAARDLPSPFAFNTPLPAIRNHEEIDAAIAALDGLESYTFYTQNYAILQAERDGKKVDLPFIFYAIDPRSFRQVFDNFKIESGEFLQYNETDSGAGRGVLLSDFQLAQYKKNYGISLAPLDSVKLLALTESGVNTVASTVVGVFSPRHYASVFNYINLMDENTYASLFNYAGVQSLPDDFNAALADASSGDEAIFGLADSASLSSLDVSSLEGTILSGYTMVAVRMKDRSHVASAIDRLLGDTNLGVKVAQWDEASGFYSKISLALQAFIFGATGLVFLVVVMIFMNTLIINVLERTSEIGTMRALGASKGFVRLLLIAETLILNVPFSILGMIVAFLLFALTKGSGFPLPETISQFLIGGGPLRLVGTPIPFLLAFFSVLVISVIATIYPVSVASSITPQAAMADR